MEQMNQMNQRVETRKTKQESHVAQSIIGTIFAVIEVVLVFRFIFKLLGANPGNGFVKGIYAVTQFVVDIFAGIFPKVTADGAVTTAVFEPATLIAIVVIAIIALIILKLMKPRISNRSEKTEYMENDKQSK